MSKQSFDSIWWLRITGMLEGISLLVLMGIAMPLKYMANKPEAVKYTGWIHGVLFVVFMALVVWVYLQQRWPFRRVIMAFLAALLPFGTFVFDRWLREKDKK
jgi:integral membrane protein